MLKSPPTLAHVALIALVTLAAAGCSEERSYPVYRENPAPKDAVPIVIRVSDAPVEVPTPQVFVTYEVEPLCLPPINNYEGVQYEPNQHKVELQAQRLSATEFSSVVFNDGMEVADYYGRGPCTWTPVLVEASFAFVIDDRPIQATAWTSFTKLETEKLATTYVHRALRPMTSGGSPEWTPTEPSAWYEKMSQDKRKDYFPIEISTRTEGTAQ
ncbi:MULTISPECIES: hypothetical protein [Stenotrophomonas]|uniref:hypothetical protein n=1 Tax=Stenotrophomonas TaxID=40323 RepID=UPI0015E04F66|nr:MULTISPECIES: hypothetical protein [Stenotrophomonas maltophilia group]MBA0401896.1 hypothetical protein [Stenotrophomonas maltophilia]MCU1133432.1 hypothetical protein [Stenotrophomonas maltophilia]